MKRNLLIVLFGLMIGVFFFWNNLFVPVVNITPEVGTNDLTDHAYPFRYFYNQSVQKGQLPLWSKNISSGYPVLAEGQIGAFYPLNLVLAILPFSWALNLTLLIDFWLLWLASWAYLRKIRVGDMGSILGATLITYSGIAITQILHYPIIVSTYLFITQLYLWERYFSTRKIYNIILMGVLLGLSFLGGHPQVSFYTSVFLMVYWVAMGIIRVYLGKNKTSFLKLLIKNFVLMVIFGLIGMGIGAAQLLPEIEFTLNSTRSGGIATQSIDKYQFKFIDLATLINPKAGYMEGHDFQSFVNNSWPRDEKYLYIGWLGIILIVIGVYWILTQRKFRRYGVVFMGTVIATLILSFGTQTTFGQIFTIPPFNFFRIPFRMLHITNLGIGVIAGIGMQGLGDFIKRKIRFKPTTYIITLSVIVLLVLDLSHKAKLLHPEVNANDWYKVPESVSIIKEKLRDEQRITEQQYFYPQLKIYSQQPDLWGKPQTYINLRNLLPNYNNLLYDIPKNTGVAISAGLKIDRYNRLEYEIHINGIDYSDPEKIIVTDAWKFLNRMMGVRYFIAGMPIAADNLLIEKQRIEFPNGQDPVIIYEFFDYFPRTFMVPQAITAEPEEILQHLLDGDFYPNKQVFVEEETDWGAKGGYAATALFEKYEDQEVVINTQASGDGWLFLSDTYYPGWKAYLDGGEVKIWLANYAFRAVQVPEGKHRVEFKFEPKSFYWGVRISVVTAGLVAVLIAGLSFRFEIRFRRKKAWSRKGN